MEKQVRPRSTPKSDLPPPGLPPVPGEKKIVSKEARIARQKARAKSLNNSPEWFGQHEPTPVQMLEDKYESAMSLEPKKEQVNRQTFTGFQEMRVKDMLVILGLWVIRLFIPWVEAWHEFNLHLLIDPHHWANYENYFATHEMFAFLGKCVLCLAISVLVDFINLRYPIYLIFVALYLSAPAVGIVSVIVIDARNYDRPYYFEWWYKVVVMMMWAMAVPFVIFPVQFSCIFDQVKDMSRMAHYNWIAIFVFIEALNACIAYWVVPPHCPTRYVTLFVVWCIIGVLMIVLFIEGLSLLRCANRQILNFNRFKKQPAKMVSADSNDMSSAASTLDVKKTIDKYLKADNDPEKTSTIKILWFFLMLVPVIFSSVVYGFLKRTRPEEDWDKHNTVTGTSMLTTGKSLGVVVTVSVLFVNRKWMKKLHRIPLLSPEVLALGFPISLNTVALLVILTRLSLLSSLSEGDVILGPIPTPDASVIEFYNVEYRNRSMCVRSENFGALKIPPHRRASTVLRDPGIENVTFEVTLDPRTTPPVVTNGSFAYKRNAWITYVLTLPSSQLGISDVEALYSKLTVVRINNTDDVRPTKDPQIVFMNTYVINTDGWYYNVTHSGQTEIIQQQLIGNAFLRSYPPGEVEVTYWTEWINIVLLGGGPPISIRLSIEEYTVYTVLLCLSNIMRDPSDLSELVPRMLQTHKTVEVAGPNSHRLPAKEVLERDWAIILGMTLAGMAQAGIYVGYVYLFWLDFPLSRFRTTCLAGLWILMSIYTELEAIKVIENVTVKEVIVLFVLQVLFTVVHFLAATFFYAPTFQGGPK